MVPLFSIAAIAVLLLTSSASATNFTCTGPATCQSAIVYTPPAATTYIELLSSFETTTLRDLFDANGLPLSTPPHMAIPATATVTVPFRCSCIAGTNRPESQPFHVVQLNDNMTSIAAQFDNFMTYQEIAAASNISNADMVNIGQELWIPLPCSCDQVDGNNVTHFAYKVCAADTASNIAARFWVKESTLLKINGITNPKSLAQGQILDVPVPTGNSTMAQNHEGKARIRTFLVITLPGAVAILAIAFFAIHVWKRPAKGSQMPWSINQDDFSLDLRTLQTATNNFDERNKLGEGGFGVVYKGTLLDGQQIAVKRLSHCSKQGLNELKNELVLVGKLQHKNLVRLLGVCVEKHEKLLVYEYMPNRSLDTFLFDRDKSKELGWEKRFKIIIEIARGLEYLHEESRLKIIHRDLKANNILLDSDLTPKISDFGLAKLFGEDQSHIVTNRFAGTYGYMAPEYAMFGQYSIKSDVFSFGVLILEIITGRRSMGSFNDHEQCFSLLDLIWQHWNRRTILDLVDPSLTRDAGGQIQRDQLLGCIHVALLCVQENPADRPKLSAVTTMIGGSNSTASLNPPSRPAFCMHPADATRTAGVGGANSSGGKPTAASANRVSLTELQPR